MPLIIEIKVVPLSARTGCKIEGNRLKCMVKSAPEKGKANNELIAYLAKALKLSRGQVNLISGATHRLKRVKIDTELTFDQLCNALGVERQLSLFKRK